LSGANLRFADLNSANLTILLMQIGDYSNCGPHSLCIAANAREWPKASRGKPARTGQLAPAVARRLEDLPTPKEWGIGQGCAVTNCDRGAGIP
jgi:hypothetical protein